MTGIGTSKIIENYNLVNTKITDTIKYWQQEHALPVSHETKLLVVTKNQSIDNIKILLDQGHRLFGENKVQEALEKWPNLISEYPDIELHMIGSLQTNKVDAALQIFHAIQVIDRNSLVDKIIQVAKNKNYSIPQCFIQLNSGEEEQKSGVIPDNFLKLLEYCQDNNLNISGIMNIPPKLENPAPHFALSKKISDNNNLQCLSMGMSDDYELAIAHGTNIVRIGSFIFSL